MQQSNWSSVLYHNGTLYWALRSFRILFSKDDFKGEGGSWEKYNDILLLTFPDKELV